MTTQTATRTWRPLASADLAAYQVLEAQHAITHKTVSPLPEHLQPPFTAADATLANHAIGLWEQGERLVATGSLYIDEQPERIRVFVYFMLDAALEHERRTIYKELLAWLEVQVWRILPQTTKQIFLRFDGYNLAQDLIELIEPQGFEYTSAENSMRRDLQQPIPAYEFPEGAEIKRWEPGIEYDGWRVYTESFRDRPGFADWDQAMWSSMNLEYEHFCPELSWIVYISDEPAAYFLTDLVPNQPGTANISHFGVTIPFRRRGLGKALFSYALQAYRNYGLHTALLHVATNNDIAFSLYNGMGFELQHCYTSYQKTL